MAEPTATSTGNPILDEIVRRLVEGLQPDRIYLFGSMARGDAGKDSDYDIMVVVSSPRTPPHLLEREACDRTRGLGVPVDVLVWARDDFDRRLSVVASLPATVMREGKLLYAA